MEIRKWNDFQVFQTKEIAKHVIEPNSAILIGKFNMKKIKLNSKDYFCRFLLYNSKNEIISTNFIFPSYFKGITLNPNTNIRSKILSTNCHQSQEKIQLRIEIDSPAYFVYILLKHDIITQYKISKNGFIQLENIHEVDLIYRNPNCNEKITEDNFIFKTLNQFLI